jgi:very-short-patch-repair endonuclease
MTAAEKKLWYEFFRGYRYRFIRQKAVENYILDFYCQKLKLGIEIDGETHLGIKNEEYDKKRSKGLNQLGIKILRFWNNDIFYGLSEVEKIIETEIKRIETPFPPERLTPFSRAGIPLCKGDKQQLCKNNYNN